MINKAEVKNINKKGFTLVELVVVIAIIAILATVSIVGYNTYIDYAKQSKVDTEFNHLADSASGYELLQDKETDVVIDPVTYKVQYDDQYKTFKISSPIQPVNNLVGTIIYEYFVIALNGDSGTLLNNISEENFYFDADNYSIKYVIDDIYSSSSFTIIFST